MENPNLSLYRNKELIDDIVEKCEEKAKREELTYKIIPDSKDGIQAALNKINAIKAKLAILN